MTANRLRAVVHAMERASDRALLVELRPAPRVGFPDFSAGDHVDLHLGQLVRQYSLVDAPGSGRYRVCVLREDAGRGGSALVHDRLRVGDQLEISAPRSTFRLPDGDGPVFLLAGGIGITPLLSMAWQLHAAGRPFELHHWARTRDDLHLSELVAGAPFADRVRTHLSSQGDSLRVVSPPFLREPVEDGHVLSCGPTGFIDAVEELARAAGWDPGRLGHERFAPAEPPKLDGDAFVVVPASTGEKLPVGSGETIAEVLQRHGYPVEMSCEVGICGSCITPVLAGVPDHRDEVQTDAEHAAGTQINVCCSRSLTPVLELDL